MNNDNTRVLACRIDEKLQQDMKKYLAVTNKTVKDYIIGLIESDLAKNALQENSKIGEFKQATNELEPKKENLVNNAEQENLKTTNDKKPSLEVLKVETKKETKLEKSKEQKTDNLKKESSKTIPLAECKEKLKKQIDKKKQKEEEEEFE